MRKTFLITTILWATISVGQTLEKGIYKGQNFPFTICYFTYTDSIIEVEYFFQKSTQIFGYVHSKKLQLDMGSSSKKTIFKSEDDSIAVFIRANHCLIKRKGHERIKVYKSLDTQTTIKTLRNRNRLFVFSQKLYDKYKIRPNFDQKFFWDKLNSYNLDKYINLENQKFNDKLNETFASFEKNYL